MSQLGRVSYSFGGGVIVTALASLFYESGGEFLAVPGMMINLFIGAVALLLSKSGEYPEMIGWQYCSVIFYGMLLYGFSWAYMGIRTERRERNAAARL